MVPILYEGHKDFEIKMHTPLIKSDVNKLSEKNNIKHILPLSNTTKKHFEMGIILKYLYYCNYKMHARLIQSEVNQHFEKNRIKTYCFL